MKGKKLLTALLLLGLAGAGTGAAVTLTGCKKKPSRTIYVAVDGVKDAKGTKDEPRELRTTLESNELKAGDTVRLLPGDYKMTRNITVFMSGEYNNYINIVCDDPTQETVISFYDLEFASTNRGVQIYSDYVHWDGVDIRGAGDNGLYIGGSYNVIENSKFYDNRDTGLQLGRNYSPKGNMYTEYADINYWPSYNLIKNCTSYNNYDNETYGENADGFAAKLTVGYGNVFDGCIAYRNSDDGWDLFAKTDSGNIGAVIMYNCVAFENGFILEKQSEFNKKFPNFTKSTQEADPEKYDTQCGDGNGFKLGGSVMEGEVFIENCLSFHNRMHGVTDNSNPGVLTVSGVTAYNNGVNVINAAGENEGKIDYSKNGVDGGCGNINMARQTYSYNHLANILSVNNDCAVLQDDEYRGTVENSTFVFPKVNGSENASDYTNIYNVEGQGEYNTKNNDRGVKGAATAADDLFKLLPDLKLGFDKDLHKKWRNADGSINLGDLFALKDDAMTKGSRLNKGGWNEYTHYEMHDLTKSKSKDAATAQAVLDMAYMPIRTEACYQNFKLVTKIKNTEIKWTSSNSELIEITDTVGTSNSHHQDVAAVVHRPMDKDTEVKITATVKVGKATKKKTFTVNVKKDTFRIGEVQIEGMVDGSIIVDKAATVFGYEVPAPKVVNGTSDGGTLIPEEYYSSRQTFKYASYDNPTAFEAANSFDPTKPGVWKVTQIITLSDDLELAKKGDGSVDSAGNIALADKIKQTDYLIYIAAKDADVSFASSELSVYRDGYKINAQFQSPTGTLYAMSVPEGGAVPDKAAIKAAANDENNKNAMKYEFRTTGGEYSFPQANSAAYNVYYYLESADESKTSPVVATKVSTVDITDKAGFENMLANSRKDTVYLLKNDIDFGGGTVTRPTTKDAYFVGLFNGNGHKLHNINIVDTTYTTDIFTGIFRSVKGGTIMNVNFEDVSIRAEDGKSQKTGIIGQMQGGYVSNVKVHNCDIYSKGERVGFIGQIYAPSEGSSVSYIDRISVTSDKDAEGNHLHRFEAVSMRVGGVVGFMQTGSAGECYYEAYINNCFVDTELKTYRYGGGIVGRSDDRSSSGRDRLQIAACVFVGTLDVEEFCGGILGDCTGGGVTRVINCVGDGKIIYTKDDVVLGVSSKNGSNIMGKTPANGDLIVRHCYAPFADANGTFDVLVFGDSEGSGEDAVSIPYPTSSSFWTEEVAGFNYTRDMKISTIFDFENVWELISTGTLKKPYVRLR